MSEGTSPPLKVALLIATLDQAGAEKQLALLARGLPRDQFEVDVIALVRGGHYADELRAAGIRVHVLGKRWKLDPRTLLALRALLKRLAPDVVHSWMFTANAYARLVGDGRATPPIIVAERGPDDWKSAWQHWVDRCLIARTSMLIVNAAEVARQAASRGFPADRVRVVANGLAVPDPARDTIAIDPRIRPTSRVVGYVGRLAAGKRVEDLIAAAALLRAQFPDLVLVLIGDGPERAALERGVAERGLSDLVCFVGHRADAADLMPRLDAFWLASENEGMSNSLMEAMAAGTPVVVSDIPGNRDLVEDGVTGCAVPLGDPRAFAAATERLWRDPARTAAMTTAATERIARAFAVERMVERYASLYREVVHDRATPHTARGAAAASVAR